MNGANMMPLKFMTILYLRLKYATNQVSGQIVQIIFVRTCLKTILCILIYLLYVQNIQILPNKSYVQNQAPKYILASISVFQMPSKRFWQHALAVVLFYFGRQFQKKKVQQPISSNLIIKYILEMTDFQTDLLASISAVSLLAHLNIVSKKLH